MQETSLVPALDDAVTVRRQLIDADPGKRTKLTVGIFFEVCLDQRWIIALADKLPKR